MQRGLFTTAWGCAAALCAAQHPLINEVRPSGSDAIELYNPGDRPIDLLGYALVMDGATHRFTRSVRMAAGATLALECDGEEGDGHLTFHLPRRGGGLLLVAPDRSSVCDVFSWPELPPGASIGRVEDGARNWAYYDAPTIGASNSGARPAARLLDGPLLAEVEGAIRHEVHRGVIVRYTTDGSVPGPGSPELPPDLVLPQPSLIAARAFAGDALPSSTTMLTLVAPGSPAYASLRVEPSDLYDADRGILVEGTAANFSQHGRAWQRHAQLELRTSTGTRTNMARIAISGSGTRSLAKKNYKVFLDPQGSDGPAIEELILRADATPHAFLRNLFMEHVARQGSQVDVQPSEPLPLYLNGSYQGTYRLMPAKNSAWLRSLTGAESVDLVDGPGWRALKGDGRKHQHLMEALERGAPLDSLSAMMETASLLDLACFDLWTGRADHDLNTRCWRPRERQGRWRWILYDMDLWAPADEHTVERLMSSSGMEAPYLRQLIAHDELRPLLLARLSAWLATALAPDRATALADSLYEAHHALLTADHARWQNDLALLPAPAISIAELRAHIAQRPAHLMEQLRRSTGQALRRMTVEVEPPGSGTLFLEGLPLTGDERSFQAFAGAPLHIKAMAAPGHEFVEWREVEAGGAEITLDPAKVKRVRAVFRPLDTTQN